MHYLSSFSVEGLFHLTIMCCNPSLKEVNEETLGGSEFKQS